MKLKEHFLRSVYVDYGEGPVDVYGLDVAAIESYFRLVRVTPPPSPSLCARSRCLVCLSQTPYFACLQDSEGDKTRLKEALLLLKDALIALDSKRAKEIDKSKKSSRLMEAWKCVAPPHPAQSCVRGVALET